VTEYEAVIGLEIHVQLRTRTKMFCGCELSFGDDPNVHTCPICLGHPGVLPVTNEKAVRYGIQIGLALGCEIAPRSIFHRKNYFYPDNPKAYQISQYDIPLCGAGRLGDVRIHRVHLEEDAAKLIHVSDSGRIHGSGGGASLVDFNRAGTPLVEIVTEPDLSDPAEVREWLQLLRGTVKSLGVSDVNMEEGSLRCDANVSIRPVGSAGLGVKTELKNMNSFRFIERGVEAELARQRDLIAGGGTVTQETLHFDPRSGALTSLRSKEEAHDYRYFPEPDLTPLVTTEAMLADARAALPELPQARLERLRDELGVAEAQARLLAFGGLGDYFEAAVASGEDASPRAIANWVTGDLTAALRELSGDAEPESSQVTPQAIAKLAAMVEAKSITNQAARDVLAKLVESGGDPAEIAEREGLGSISDAGELEAIVAAAIGSDPAAADRVKGGNMKAIGPLIGYVMRETKGRADGGEVTKIICSQLGL
jgi:aspartyl-tRNA(Asn)/glutamyl-tRNA(Gln) amidotransferase subunit B